MNTRKEFKYGTAPIDGDEFLNVEEISSVLKMSVRSVNTLCNKTDFPAKKIPYAGWRARKSDIFQYVDNLTKNQY